MPTGVRQDKVQISVEINGKQVKNTISDLNKSYKQLNREIQHLTPGTEAFNKKAKEIQNIKGYLDNARNAIRGFSQAQGLMSKGFTLMKNAAKSFLATFLPLLALTEIINTIKAAFDMSQEVQNAKEEINLFTGDSGEQLEKTTASILGMSRTFDVEVNEVLQSGNAFMREFGLTSDETFSLIEKGLIATGNKGDEFLEQTREYSAQFSALGFTAEQTGAFIAGAIREGTFNDTAADSVKELGLRLGDLTKGQKEVLEQNFGKQFADQIASGEQSTATSLSQISTKLNEMREDGVNITPVIANIFGGPGENVGERFILSLSNIDKSFNDLIDTSNVYTRRQLEQLELEKELAAAQSELAYQLEGTGSFFQKVGTIISTFFVNVLSKSIQFFKYFPENWQIFKATAAEALNSVITRVENFINKVVDVLDVFDVIGNLELPKLEILKSADELESELQTQIDADRRAFAEQQEQKALSEAKKSGEAERLQRLRDQKRIAKEAGEAAAKEYEKAQRAIEDLRIEVMAEGQDKEITLLKLRTQREIEELKGSASQITEQRKLLLESQNQQIDDIRRKYIERREAEDLKAEKDLNAKKQKEYNEYLSALEEARKKESLLATNDAVSAVESGSNPETIDQELKARLLIAEQEFLEDKIELQNLYGLSNLEATQELENLKLAATQARITQEQALEEDKDRKRKELGRQLVESLVALDQALGERKLKKLEEQKEKELKAAEGNEAKQAKIEEKFQKLKEKQERNAALKKKAIAATTTIINTAQSIVKTGADLGYPAAIPFQIAAGVIGAINLATILAQTFAEGGFTGKALFGVKADRTGQRPVGLVHENEWVGPSWMTRHPVYGQQIAQLEAVRSRGFADGGFTTPSDEAVGAASSSTQSDILREEFTALRQDFNNMQFVTVWTERHTKANQDMQGDMNSRRALGNLN